jgi:VWFA-related protein
VKRLVWLLIFCLNAHAQEPQDVVRVSTNLVQVDVVVTKDGKPVLGLKPDDFEIREDGRLQQITNFTFVSVSSPFKVPPNTASDFPGSSPPAPSAVKRTVAIVVDDLGMSFESMSNLRQYLRKFVSEGLGANDLVAIIRTGGEVGALQQFTTDARVLTSAIAELKWNPCSRVGARVLSPDRSLVTLMPPEPEMRGRVPPDRSPSSNQVQRPTVANESNPCSVGNSVNHSINAIRFVLRGMQELPGRKSLLIVSDNLPMERQEDAPPDFGYKRPVRDDANLIDVWTQASVYNDGLHGLAEQAIRSSVVIYGVSSQRLQTVGVQAADEVNFAPLNMTRGRGAAEGTHPTNNPLSRLTNGRSAELTKNFDGAELLAKETGGFVIRNTNDFGVDRVLEDQNGYYLIGYRPATETFQRHLHKIQVRVKARGYAVRTRAGFYDATENATAGPPTERDRMKTALLSPFGAKDIAVRLKAFFANDPVRGSLLRNFVVVDAKDLTFYTEANGMPTVRYEVSYVLFNENGAVVDRQDQTMTMQLSQEVFERAQREGMVYSFDLPLKRTGSFQLRVALRDVRSQRIGSASQFVQTPNLSDGRLALSGVLLYAEGPGLEPDDWNRALVLRRFQHGASLVYGYTIYNAALDKKTQRPQLTTRTEIFRDSVKVYSSDRVTVAIADQTDLKRINAGARLQLGSALTPGEYVVQIVVEDQVAKRRAVQVTKFEVK